MKRHLTRIGMVIVGDEILLGRRADLHFSRALEYFPGLGIDIGWIYYLGDDLAELADHFLAIRSRGDVCFCFGGIGATPDDVTRQAVARAHDLAVVRHPEAVRLIEEQFGSEAYPNRILMADLPAGARLIPNRFNNIPGFSVGEIHCLPGFPEMAWPMLRWTVETCYHVTPHEQRLLRRITVDGARESELIGLLESLQQGHPEVKISSLPQFPQQGNWRIELGVRGGREAVDEVIGILSGELRARGYRLDGETT